MLMKIIKIKPKNKIEHKIKEIIRKSDTDPVFCYPTDTVYGIGANVYKRDAVEKIYYLKNREISHQFSIIIDNVLKLKELIAEMNKSAAILIEKFWPGALTLIFKASQKSKDQIAGVNETIGIRLPNNKICGLLIEHIGFPIISTSANIAGGKVPHSVEEIPVEIRNNCNFVIDAGKIKSTGASTVIDVSSPLPAIIREGAITVDEIKKYTKL